MANKPVSILILPPLKVSAMNLNPKNLESSSYFPIKEVVCFFLILVLFRKLEFGCLSPKLFFKSDSLPKCQVHCP
jgi:hypothetical protein